LAWREAVAVVGALPGQSSSGEICNRAVRQKINAPAVLFCGNLGVRNELR
jgi:hypothetical protein